MAAINLLRTFGIIIIVVGGIALTWNWNAAKPNEEYFIKNNFVERSKNMNGLGLYAYSYELIKLKQEKVKFDSRKVWDNTLTVEYETLGNYYSKNDEGKFECVIPKGQKFTEVLKVRTVGLDYMHHERSDYKSFRRPTFNTVSFEPEDPGVIDKLKAMHKRSSFLYEKYGDTLGHTDDYNVREAFFDKVVKKCE